MHVFVLLEAAGGLTVRGDFSIKEESSDKYKICDNFTIRVVVCVSLFLFFVCLFLGLAKKNMVKTLRFPVV